MTPDHSRAPLTRARVIDTAIALADTEGLDGLSMRALAERLGVVPMALYKHVRHKEELLDAMVDAVILEIDPQVEEDAPWKRAARVRVLAAREVMLRHSWAWFAIETRQIPSPVALDHMEAMIATLRSGLPVDLVHHLMHALGSRVWGFSQEVYASPAPPMEADARAAAAAMLAERWPHVLESASSARHDDGTTVGPGCDDEFEFEFGLDLLLDGAERLHAEGWRAPHS